MPPTRWQQKFFQARAWVSYWLEAVNEHSLHPPFVFGLYQQVVKAPDQKIGEIEKLRSQLLQSNQLLEIKELGAGSSVSNARKRPISSIARNSLTPSRFSCLLYRLVRFCNAHNILELGTSLGLNTLYLAAAAPTGTIHTLEGCPQTAALADSHFQALGAGNIKLHTGNIDALLPSLLAAQLPKLDLAYLDANHTLEATLRYFHWLLPYLHANSVVVIDDIHWSEGMQEAWKVVCSHPTVSLSVDLYEGGLLFFTPQLQKQHWVLAF